MPHLTLRDYTLADWPAVCRVHDRARPLELYTDPNFPVTHPVQTLAQAAEADGFFTSRTAVALIDTTVVAFASTQAAYLSFLYVDPDHHRRGIARALLEHVKPWLGPDGYTHTAATNAPAIALYLSVGMEIACRFPGESEGIGGECLRLAFPTSTHRHRPARPAALALQLEAARRGIPVESVPKEWPAEP